MKKALFCFFVISIVLTAGSQALAASCGWTDPHPTVISTDPIDGATGVPLNQIIRVTFDLDMDDNSVTRDQNHDGYPDNIRVRNTSTGTYIPGKVTYDPAGGGTAIFTPAANLQPNITYEVTVRDRVLADNGCDLACPDTNPKCDDGDYVFQFTTGAASGDTTPPTIIAASPAHGSTGNPVTTFLTINFSEPMDPGTITEQNITVVANSTTPVTGTVSYIAASQAATFTPTANLSPNTTYTVTVRTPQVKDVAGNGLNVSNSPVSTSPASYTWSFTTIITDTTEPTVTAVVPINNATAVSVSTPVTATFSEALNPATVTGATFFLKSGNTTIAGTVTYDPALFQAIFTPAGTLSNSTTYTATLTTGVTDVAGNSLAVNYVWSFTTAALIPTASMDNYCQTPPFITSTSRVKPNVLLLVDNSGSMSEFAYKAKGKGDSTWDDSYDSGAKYYGYFDSQHMYKYDTTSGGFFTIDTAWMGTADNTSFWSGNFLNWLTMRRVDVVRKVLVGGKTSPRSANTANYLIGYESPDRDNLKSYASTYYKIGKGNSYGQISVCATSSCRSYSATYNIKVYVGNNPPDEGIIIKMSDRIRFGIMFFNDGYRFENNQNSVRDGGYVGVDIGSTGTNLITQVENTDPSTWTPLAEALYEATRYFEADNSAYNGGTYSGKDPIEFPCQKNFVLMLTDGESTMDQNLPGTAFAGTAVSDITNGNFNVQTWMNKIQTVERLSNPSYVTPSYNGQTGLANSSDGTYYLEAVAYWAHTTDLRRGATDPLGPLGNSDIAGKQNLTIYTVFAFDDSPVGRELLQKAAKYGGYVEKDGVFGPNDKGEWSKDGDDFPDTYFEAQSGGAVADTILRALNDILAQVSSGTATSILSSSEGSGANIMQAIFYPKRIFSASSEVDWIGEVQNMWYYLDPMLGNSSVMEDTDHNFVLNLFSDYMVQSRYDTQAQLTVVDRSKSVDSNSDGAPDTEVPVDTISLDQISSLWRAGKQLLTRNIRVCSNDASTTCSTDLNCVSPGTCTGAFSGFERSIYTTLDGSALSDFRALDTTSPTVLGLLQAANSTEAAKIINFTHGIDQPGYRSRNVKTCSGNDSIYCSDNSTCSAAGAGTCLSRIWKLGDVVSSTPKVQSNFALNNYYKSYGDASYASFVGSSAYRSRGTVYVGANDGMLHAFSFGTLDVTSSTFPNIAKLCKDEDGNNLCNASDSVATLGKEQWAFIPENVLPYLKYMADPNYCHLYTVDLSPTIFDASINVPSSCSEANYWNCPKQTKCGANAECSDTNYVLDQSNTSWRTILIGGMRLGGACKAAATANGVGVPVNGVGYSSYFALDVTNPANPTLLWEFVPPTHDMGFASTGPAIIRISARKPNAADLTKSDPDKSKNGRWFAVFASGPTGPIDAGSAQFKGFSDQPLKLFVVDVKTGALVRKITTFADNTSLPANAFGGSLFNANIDYDIDYQDDAMYLGYTKSEVATPDSTTLWNAGGVLRLVTKEDLDGSSVAATALDPANWEVSRVIDDVGPVTSAVAHLAHYPQKIDGSTSPSPDIGYLFFGTGRYYYTIDTGSDDVTAQRRIYGVKEPCLKQIIDKRAYGSCPSFDTANLADVSKAITDTTKYTGININDTNSPKSGWFLNLAPAAGSLYSERIVTDPLATSMGVVFVTSFAPSTDICSFGGKSYLWGLRYDTGGTVNGILKGKALMQVSTGAIEEIDLHGDPLLGIDGPFIESGQRRTAAMSGAPPTGMGLAIVVQPPPTNRMQHLRRQ